MDRDNRWERIARVYWAMTRGEGSPVIDPAAAIAESYERKVTDEFIEPCVVMENGRPVTLVEAGDSVIYFNFRSDRGRELTKAFVLPELPPRRRASSSVGCVWTTALRHDDRVRGGAADRGRLPVG